jgi:hypothetical protein
MRKARGSFDNSKKYVVQAKRKNTKEEWTDWALVDNYSAAQKHADRVKELGHSVRIITRGGNPNE